jgi:hypothetical protein
MGDIGRDRITIKAHASRPLKTPQSEREVPLHPLIQKCLVSDSPWTDCQKKDAIFPDWYWKKKHAGNRQVASIRR